MNVEPQLPRRQFVKLLTFCGVTALAGSRWQGTLLADITPSSTGKLLIKLSDYPPLQEDFGSVRLGVTPMADPFTTTGMFYPVIINRVPGDQFFALDSACRHAGCVVAPFTQEERLFCGCHGSRYDYDGSLLNGPATSGLFAYQSHFDGVDTLTVEIPALGYCVTGSTVEGVSTPRFQLSFPTFALVEYEVRFRETVTAPWMVVPFSLTSEGPADQLFYLGDDLTATVYVGRTAASGFYAVAIKILDLTNASG